MLSRRYIKLILPLRLEWEPCYYLSGDVGTGQRVIVKFAGRRTVGVVSEVDITPDIDPSRIQPVLQADTGLDPISAREIELWRFVADYYLCTIGEVYKAAYPSQKTASEELEVHRTQRKQALESREEEIWRQRIARLHSRLDAKNADLCRKHGEAVRIRLEAQRDAIIVDLKEAERRLADLSHNLGIEANDFSALLARVPDLKAEPALLRAIQSGRPTLLKSADRNSDYIQTAAQTLRAGKNVCILVNETALAGQLCDSLKATFGELLLAVFQHLVGRELHLGGDALQRLLEALLLLLLGVLVVLLLLAEHFAAVLPFGRQLFGGGALMGGEGFFVALFLRRKLLCSSALLCSELIGGGLLLRRECGFELGAFLFQRRTLRALREQTREPSYSTSQEEHHYGNSVNHAAKIQNSCDMCKKCRRFFRVRARSLQREPVSPVTFF